MNTTASTIRRLSGPRAFLQNISHLLSLSSMAASDGKELCRPYGVWLCLADQTESDQEKREPHSQPRLHDRHGLGTRVTPWPEYDGRLTVRLEFALGTGWTLQGDLWWCK